MKETFRTNKRRKKNESLAMVVGKSIGFVILLGVGKWKFVGVEFSRGCIENLHR